MTDFPLPKSLENSHRVFTGKRFNVHTKEVEGRNGKKYQRDVVIHPGAVIILPLLDKDTVVLIQNYRIAVDELLWELPAGTRELNEEPIETAKRELIEETGYQASHVIPLLDFYTSPGICNENMFVFVAKDLKHVGQQLEDSEEITVKLTHWDEILKMIKTNEIRDGKTIATLLFYQAFMRADKSR